MALGVLAIAQGAAKIAGKIVTGVRNRREKAINKAASKLVQRQARLDEAEAFFTPGIIAQPMEKKERSGFLRGIIGAGTRTITNSGNDLAAQKAMSVVPISGSQAVSQEATPNDKPKFNPMILVGGALLVALLFLRKR